LPTIDAGVDAPTRLFADLGIPAEFLKVLNGRGITSPLPIQEATIPDALEGRDVSGKAPTGSGKTLAFAIPMAARIKRARPQYPHGLVLAPTRELAAQIATELAPLASTQRLRVHAFYGGVGFGPQLKALRSGVDIAVACPGRLEDLMSSGHIRLAEVEMVVIDEADRMADMGFLPAVQRILDATTPDRQTLLFSATLDGEVDQLVRRYQRKPVRHEVVADIDELARTTHTFQTVAHTDRAGVCAALVADAGATVVFVRTRHGADRLAKQLERSGVRAAAIHGDRSQAQRDRALAAFRSGSVRALVATDVAARGIHVADVDRVIHFDLAADAKDYVHRSGRTARAGASGSVVSLVMPEQQKAAAALRRSLRLDAEVLGATGRPITPPSGSADFEPRRGPERTTPRDGASRHVPRGGSYAGRSRAGSRNGSGGSAGGGAGGTGGGARTSGSSARTSGAGTRTGGSGATTGRRRPAKGGYSR
jgi:superfamily II DNA/RNA helicase